MTSDVSAPPTYAKPPLSAFGKKGSNGWAKAFVASLNGEPAMLPLQHQNESGRVAVYNAGKVRGLKVSTLTYEGMIWAAKV